MFVTAWMGVLDIDTGKVEFVNAGHNPPLVRHKDGSFEYLRTKPCFVLAGMDGVKYRKSELDLAAGDEIYLHTDGVTEATNANEELYGESRLNELLDGMNELSGEEICRAAKGEETISDWSKPMLCSNRYFPAMNWMITGRCNYNCIHCFNAADNAPLMSEWTMDEANKLLDEAQSCGINAFTITGGEPMFHKNFFDILEGIYRRGMYVEELNTNGYFITNETLARMKKIGCMPLMKISFDGIGYHDYMRNRKGAENSAIKAISLCLENGFRVKVQTNMNRRNRESMLKTAEIFDAMGACEMRIIRTTEAPRWVKNAGDACLTLREYFDESIELWQKYSRGNHKMPLTVWQLGTLYPEAKIYTLTAVNTCREKYRDSAPVCKGNRGMVAVGANGRVYPCHQMSGYYEQHGDILGNAKETPLAELLSGGKYLEEVCATLKTLREHNEKCDKCRFFEQCNGGCRAVALALTGDKLGSDPSKCLFWEEGYDKKITDLLPDFRVVT